MTPQSYANHRRYVPGYHYYTSLAALVVLGWAGYRAARDFSLDHAMLLLLVVVVVLTLYWARAFALGTQDRIIRLEERLRLARLLPEPLRARVVELSTPQLVALRFASDGEVAELAKRVLDEKITSTNQIKRLIKEWRPDYSRI